MRIEFTPTFGEQYSAALAATRRSTISLLAALAFPLMAVILFLLIVLVARRLPSLGQLVLIVVLVAFTPAMTAFNVWLVRRKNRTVEGPHVITVEEAGLRIAAPTFETLLRWEAIRRVAETPRFFLVFISAQMAQYIPKRIMTAEQISTLRQLMEQKAKL